MTRLPAWPPAAGRKNPIGEGGTEWIFDDPNSRRLLSEVEQLAPSDANVLITGETGTGKELIARHIHARSARKAGPFVVVSCGAFSEALVDAELFGHEDGAIAGAFGASAGWFEKAHGGTIFLDEVNDLPLTVQNKLLRVLQEREIFRLGGRKPIAIDIRVLAATTLDLQQLIAARRFRADLYYRLNVASIHVLTLKDRPGDILPLARHFIDSYSRRLGYPRLRLSELAERALKDAPWVGNVRELENVIHRTLLHCDGPEMQVSDLRLSRQTAQGAGESAPVSLPLVQEIGASGTSSTILRAIRELCESNQPNLYQVVEDALFREVYRYCHYSQSEAARLLGVSRNVVRARLARLGEIGPARKAADFDSAFTE